MIDLTAIANRKPEAATKPEQETETMLVTMPQPAETTPSQQASNPQPVRPENATATVEAIVREQLPTGNGPLTIEPIETLQKLSTSGRTGDFVLNGQETDKDFRNVSAAWTAKCMTFEQAREQIEIDRGKTQDILAPLGRFQPVVDNGIKMLDRETGEHLQLTDNSLRQLGDWCNTGATLPKRLSVGDEQDVEVLQSVFENGLRKMKSDKQILVRKREGSLRALLTEKYAIIDNLWFMDVLERAIPGGLISHFRGDGDAFFFNVLIPDTLRQESDSEYGGMLASGNSEIGTRRLSTLPSVFRAICMNGCIWDQVEGTAYSDKRHSGNVDLELLEANIRKNLDMQIPLLSTGIDSMLDLQSHNAGTLSPMLAVGQTLKVIDCQVTKPQAEVILEHYKSGRSQSEVSAFDILQGMTSAAQKFNPADQEMIERAAGQLLSWDASDWSGVWNQASKLNTKSLKSIYPTALVS